MINIFRGYVRTKDKKPIQKFKDVDELPTLDEISGFDEYAGILNDDYVVMDVDDGVESDKTYNLVKHLNLNCRVVQTSRGKHFIFKKNPELRLKGTTKNINAIGITFDIRIGVNQYIVVKYGGNVRNVLREFDETKEISAYPAYFAPIRSTTKFTSMGEGDGRNGKLYAHIATLTHNGFAKNDIIDICRWINEFMFDSPLSESEMKTITRDEAFSELNEFDVEKDFADYSTPYKPKNLTELCMAELFTHYYSGVVRYNSGIGFLVWNGKVWEMSDSKANLKYFEFLKKVQKTAKLELYNAATEFDEKKLKDAENFVRFVSKMQDGNKITSVMKIAKNLLHIDLSELDANPFELNTPSGIINLKTGVTKLHDPASFCTKMTACEVRDDDPKLWDELLELVTLGDEEYKEYLQVLCGSSLIGKVFNESLIIAQGGGANGKSTMFNVIFKIIGDYAGKIPAESLTTKAKNIKVDLATLFGKRFILASETEEGQRLSNQMLKQIASTDVITAEKKYHDPFTFEPSHSALLYTNFLPSLGSLDNGTKRRIIICPFNAEITKPIKDYADRLYESSRGTILKWLIEGAKKYCSCNYTFPPCNVCEEAKRQYIEDNDWLGKFLADCCNVDKLSKQAGSVLYKAYRKWANEIGEWPRRNSDFSKALIAAGFTNKKTEKGVFYSGICLLPEALEKVTEDVLLS